MHISMQFHFDSFEEFHAWVLRTTGQAPIVVPEMPSAPVDAPVSAAPGPEAPESVAARMARPRGRPRKNPEPVVPAPQAEPTPEPAAPAPSPALVNDQPAPPVNAGTEPAPAAAAPTEDDVKAALERVFQARGFQGAQQVLQRLGVSRLRDLPADQYPALIAEAGKPA
jgi:hypothetical protein